MPTWGQPPAEDAVSPERIHELMRRFDSLSTAGKSAVLDYLIEAANKPADRLVDTLPLRQALRSSGPQIARLANDPQSPLRLQALAALGKVHCAVDDVVPAWRSALAENRFELDQAVGAGALAYLRRGHQVREGAMMETKLALLESVVTDLNGLAPLLPRLQRSPVLATRINAYEAVGAFFELLGNVLEREGEAQIPALVSIRRQLALLPENLAGFFREAQTALAKFQAPELRSVLTNLEMTADVCISREAAATSLARSSSGRLLQFDLEPQGRQAAKALLAELRSLVPAVAESLKSPQLGVRLAACELLESLGSEGIAGVDALLGALKDPNPFVRWAATRALGKLNPTDPVLAARIVNGFVPLLVDPDLGVRAVAALALEQYGEKAAPAVKGLSELAKRTDAVLQLAAVQALAACGPAAKEGIPGLLAALRSQDERVRELVPPILGRLGKDAVSAAPGLREALSDSSATVRLRAAEALVRIEASGALP